MYTCTGIGTYKKKSLVSPERAEKMRKCNWGKGWGEEKSKIGKEKRQTTQWKTGQWTQGAI